MKLSPPNPLLRLLTAALVLPVALQLLGLNVLCFCGACPASQVLWPQDAAPAEPTTHACCHHTEDQDVDASLPSLAGQSCCGDDHVWRPATLVAPDGHPPLPVVAQAILPAPPLPVVRATRVAKPLPARFLARGPPPVPIYLQHRSLQI